MGPQGVGDGLGNKGTAGYWTDHNVTMHHEFDSADESLAHFDWRNDQYPGYIDLMPVEGQEAKDVLDFGCGPGHDLVGFGHYSHPKRLVGVDLSSSSLREARRRLSLHGINAELVQLDPEAVELPFDDCSFDYIHSSGVLHHTPNPVMILKEFKRLLKPKGCARVMVYNYDSVWVHLYVAYQRAILQGLYANESLRDQFRRSTDGEDCPISNCYKPVEWMEICKEAELKCEFLGTAVSMHEMSLLPLRYSAVQDKAFLPESRKFILNLTFDEMGYPLYNGSRAGIDACYLLSKDIGE